MVPLREAAWRFARWWRGPACAGPPLVLFKALLLQSLYGLSDRELEEALADRLSFRCFAGLGLDESVPDHTVLARFRNLLVGEGLLETLFGELDRQLEKAGLVLKRGTMLDATLIEAVSAPPSGERLSKDPDARLTKRQGKAGSTFGYKAHVGVDEGSGLIRSVITTPDNVNDTTLADGLIRGDEQRVWADHTHARLARLKAEGRKARIARLPNKHHPELPACSKRYNRLIARRRGSGRNHLRHPQTAHEARHDPLCRPGQGERTGADGRDRLQHAKMGGAHAIVAPAIEPDQTDQLQTRLQWAIPACSCSLLPLPPPKPALCNRPLWGRAQREATRWG